MGALDVLRVRELVVGMLLLVVLLRDEVLVGRERVVELVLLRELLRELVEGLDVLRVLEEDLDDCAELLELELEDELRDVDERPRWASASELPNTNRTRRRTKRVGVAVLFIKISKLGCAVARALRSSDPSSRQLECRDRAASDDPRTTPVQVGSWGP